MADLFRAEAAGSRRARLDGDVLRFEPAKRQRLLLVAIGLMLISGLVGTFVPIPQSARLRGVVVPDTGLMSVPSQDGWRIVEILGREGQILKAGQPIARLEYIRDTPIAGEPSILESYKSRLEAQTAQGVAEARARRAEVTALRVDQEGRQAALIQVGRQIELARERVTLANATLERAQTLIERGYLTQFDVESRRHTLLSERSALASLEREGSELASAIRSNETRIEGLLAADAAAIQSQVGTRAALAAESRRSVRETSYVAAAPQLGRLLLLNYRSGETTRSATPLALLAPPNGRPTIDFYASPRDALRLKPRQPVTVRLEGADLTAMSPLRGEVLSVSPLIRPAEEIFAPGLELNGPMLAVRVQVDTRNFPLALSTGMLASGKVTVDRRSLFQRVFQRGIAA